MCHKRVYVNLDSIIVSLDSTEMSLGWSYLSKIKAKSVFSNLGKSRFNWC